MCVYTVILVLHTYNYCRQGIIGHITKQNFDVESGIRAGNYAIVISRLGLLFSKVIKLPQSFFEKEIHN